jgi:hypothetical protein
LKAGWVHQDKNPIHVKIRFNKSKRGYSAQKEQLKELVPSQNAVQSALQSMAAENSTWKQENLLFCRFSPTVQHSNVRGEYHHASNKQNQENFQVVDQLWAEQASETQTGEQRLYCKYNVIINGEFDASKRSIFLEIGFIEQIQAVDLCFSSGATVDNAYHKSIEIFQQLNRYTIKDG